MSFQTRCPNCDQTLRVNARMAGRKVRCPQCDTVVVVPQPRPATESAAGGRGAVEAVAGGGAPTAGFQGPGAAGKNVPAPDPATLATGGPAAAGEDPRGPATDSVLFHDVEEEEMVRRKKRDDEELDMTPMVDVTFLLLIFFMVTASFSLQKSIQMPRQTSDLPSLSPVEQETEELDPVEVEIDEYGSFFVLAPDWERETPGKQNLTTALKEAIGSNPEGMRLSIKVHELAKLQALVDAMDAGTVAGFAEIEVTQVEGF